MLGDIGEGNSRRQDSQDGELRNVGLLRDHTAPDIYPDKSAFYTENNMTYQASQIETTGLGLSSSEQADSSGLTVDSAARRKHKGKERALDDEFEGQDQSPKSPALLLSPASSPESYPIDFRYGSALQNSDADEEYPPTTDSAKEYRVIEQYLSNMYKTERARKASIRHSGSRFKSSSGPNSNKPMTPQPQASDSSDRSSSILSRMTSRRSTSSSGRTDSKEYDPRPAVVPMADLTEASREEEAAHVDPVPSNSKIPLSIETSSTISASAMVDSPSSVLDANASTVTLTPTERAIKTGSRFAEDLVLEPPLPSNLKRHSAPATRLSPPSSIKSSRFRMSLQHPNISSSSIFRPFSSSRTSLQMMFGPPGEDELGAGGSAPPRISSPGAGSLDIKRSSYFYGDADSSRPAISRPVSWASSYRSSPQSKRTHERGYSTSERSILMEHEGHQRSYQNNGDNVTRQHSANEEEDVLDGQRKSGQRCQPRQQMGWAQWLCCLGCMQGAEDSDDEAQCGKTGPDLL